jgi:hypothetical protein
VLVRISWIVLGRDVVTENDVGKGLEAVSVTSRNIDGNWVGFSYVRTEDFAGRAVEDDDAGGADQTGEEVVLSAIVIVEAADHPFARERDVRLHGPLPDPAFPPYLEQPATFVAPVLEWDELEPFDHRLAPCLRTKSFTS